MEEHSVQAISMASIELWKALFWALQTNRILEPSALEALLKTADANINNNHPGTTAKMARQVVSDIAKQCALRI